MSCPSRAAVLFDGPLLLEPIDLTYDNTDPFNHADRWDGDDYASYGPAMGLLDVCIECGYGDGEHDPMCLGVD